MEKDPIRLAGCTQVPRRTGLTSFRRAVQRVASSLQHFHLSEDRESRKTGRTSLLGRNRSRTMDDGEMHKENHDAQSGGQFKESARQVPKSGAFLSRHQSQPHLATTDTSSDGAAAPVVGSEKCSSSRCHDRCQQLPGCPLPEEQQYVRVYKKTSSSGKLAIYLTDRDLTITRDTVSPLHGVATFEPEENKTFKVFAQMVLTFRYGRDDEEVMGLKLSNESIICMEQIYPSLAETTSERIPSQDILLKRLGPEAYPFTLKLGRLVPPSVRLLPATEYRGAAIGICYDLRVFVVEGSEEKPHRKNQVRMGIRLVQYAPEDLHQAPPPTTSIEKNFLLREGCISLQVGLDRQWYPPGMPITVHVQVNNRSSKTVRKIRVTAIQHVDVSMFSNGKFKNVVATSEDCSGITGSTLEKQYTIEFPENCTGRHWVALEDRYGKLTSNMASTTLKSNPTERNFFAIYISYYVKVRLILNGVGGDVTAKVPFILMREGPEIVDDDLPVLNGTEQGEEKPTEGDVDIAEKQPNITSINDSITSG